MQDQQSVFAATAAQFSDLMCSGLREIPFRPWSADFEFRAATEHCFRILAHVQRRMKGEDRHLRQDFLQRAT